MKVGRDIREMEKTLGKQSRVQVIVESSSDCPDCNFNPVTKQSTDAKCQTCGGRGRVYSSKRIVLPAFVQRRRIRDTSISGGINLEGEIQLYVDYRTVMNFKRFLNGRNRLYIDNAEYEIVDNARTGVFDSDMMVYTCEKVEQ